MHNCEADRETCLLETGAVGETGLSEKADGGIFVDKAEGAVGKTFLLEDGVGEKANGDTGDQADADLNVAYKNNNKKEKRSSLEGRKDDLPLSRSKSKSKSQATFDFENLGKQPSPSLKHSHLIVQASLSLSLLQQPLYSVRAIQGVQDTGSGFFGNP
ncbi:hypothetical protein Q3G72_020888 [Acer saccharum]|nr:hypothetical protein Q3G72_020888 [Acer saccharum]